MGSSRSLSSSKCPTVLRLRQIRPPTQIGPAGARRSVEAGGFARDGGGSHVAFGAPTKNGVGGRPT